ncbi:cyclase family protein [Paenibacillus dakarensis]|uniref:cyclase family protein n=1 Tax=Paenibacillus dakarensis TaxID=1527293 RepID=UPI0006D5746C|nr:cyclase family protein [Paenibacillus dakarensis]
MIIDLTHTIQDRLPVFPGDEETTLQHSKVFQNDHYSNHQLNINMHAGTHIDGPMHLTDSNTYLNEIPLETFIGEGCLLDVSNQTEIMYKSEYEDLIKPNQIVILHTGHSKHFGEPLYFTDYPVITMDFAELLVRKQVKMIGLDTPSPDRYPYEIHKFLFNNNILIIENLTNVEQLLNKKSFEIIALPLSIKADSSVARVIARLEG